MANFLKSLFVKGVEIDTASATAGKVLTYDGTKFAPATPGSGSLALDDLSDVVITTPAEFQTLEYNGTNWVNAYSSVVTYVRNAEATTLTTGTCVYLFGATGDHATVKRADNNSDATSSKTIGLVGASITASNNGPVITRGYVDGINLSTGYTAGDVLWLGEAGAFTTTKPTAPDHLVFIGVVVRATNNGIIYVATQNGYELDELHNVSLPSPASGEFLKYNGSLWVADAIDLGTDTTGNYMSDISGTSPVSVTHTPAEGSSATVALAASYGDTQNPYASKTANYVLAAPNGSSGAPTFRAIVAADIPTLNQNTTGTAATVTGAAQTAITSVGTLTSLTVGGAGANRSITINAPSSYYAIQYFQINGVSKWHYEVNPDGTKWSLVQSGVAERIGVTSTGATFSGTVTATTFAGSGASLTSIPNSATTATSANTSSAIVARDASGNFTAGTITAALTGTASGNLVSGGALGTPSSGTLTNCTSIPAGNLTGTIANARLPAAATNITSLGTLTGLTVDGASSPAITFGDWPAGAGFASIVTSKGYLLLGATSGNDEVYLRSTTAGTNVRIGGNQADMLVVGGTTASFAGDVSNSGSYSTAGYFISTSGLAGSGQAAQWLAAFGQYYLMRVTSTRNDKENVQPLNGIVTPSMIDDIDVLLWSRKGASGFPEIGPMAEDMDDISPFLSSRGMDYDEDGNVVSTPPEGINQNSWLSLLTIALQDSRKRIVELENIIKQGENNG